MGLAAAIKRRWFGKPQAPAKTAAGTCPGWSLAAVKAGGGVLGYTNVILTESGVVPVPIHAAGQAVEVHLKYDCETVLRFPLNVQPHVASGDAFNFHFANSLKKVNALSGFAASVISAVGTMPV